MSSEKTKTCFVIMPISDPPGYEPGHFLGVYEHVIKPAVEKAGFTALRADEVNQTNHIAIDVLQRLVESEMAVCDLSSRNPNCLYELGIRHALKKPVTLLKDSKTDRIFDIQGIRDMEYDVSLRIDRVKPKIDELAMAIESTYEGKTPDTNSPMTLVEAVIKSFHDDLGKRGTTQRRLEPSALPEAARPIQWSTTGLVVKWDQTRRFGFIDSNGQSHFFNWRTLAHDVTPKVGDTAYFLPKESFEPDGRPSAACVLIKGNSVRGSVVFVNMLKRFAFAEVEDQNGNTYRLFVSLYGYPDNLRETETIEATVDENEKGVIGVDLSVVARGTGRWAQPGGAGDAAR